MSYDYVKIAAITSKTQLEGLLESVKDVLGENNATVLPSRAVESDASGFLKSSSVTSLELGYLSGLTGSLTSLLGGKVGTTGNETIGDVKTFSSAPIVSTLTAGKLVEAGVGGVLQDSGLEETDLPTLAADNVFTGNNTIPFHKTLTKSVTIGLAGSGADYVFASAADAVEQVLTITNILPAFARLNDAVLVCTETIGTITDMATELGTTSSGNEVFASASNKSLNDITAIALAAAPVISITAANRSLYIASTPTGNWDTATAGAWKLYVTYTLYT